MRTLPKGTQVPDGNDRVSRAYFEEQFTHIDEMLPEAAVTANDMIFAGGAGAWIKKTLDEAKEILGITDSTITTQTLVMGANTTTLTGATQVLKVDFTPKHIVNLLGRDGNSGDIAKWTPAQATRVQDTTNTVLGRPSIKVTVDTSNAEHYCGDYSYAIATNKYYFVTGYVKPIAGKAGVRAVTWNGATPIGVVLSTAATDTSKFTRVGVRINTTGVTVTHIEARMQVLNAAGSVSFTGTTENASFGGMQVVEITASEYANDSDDVLMARYPYVDSVGATVNPTLDIVKDNLVRNGNTEEGLGYWRNADPTNTAVSVENGSFKLQRLNTQGYVTIYQDFICKEGQAHALSAVLKTSGITAGAATISVYHSDDGVNFVWLSTVVSSTATAETTYTNTFTPTKKYVRILLNLENVNANAIAYFKSVIVIPGSVAPTAYKTQRRTQTTLVGNFLNGDAPSIDAGQAVGSKLWKDKTLYGKDNPWAYVSDNTGSKLIEMAITQGMPADTAYPSSGRFICTKYDGKLLIDPPANNDSAWFTAGLYRITVMDIDSGWAETVAPNNDEVKAFMNGWCAFGVVLGSRYVIWRNVLYTDYAVNVNAYPSGFATTLSVTTNGTTSITVADAGIFKVGDYVAVIGVTNPLAITAINGNVLTLSTTVTAGGGAGLCVVRCDNGTTDTRFVAYCKANVAPNYEGYKLYYKLQTAQPIGKGTDDYLVPVKGDIPELEAGVNTVVLDTGIVRGEAANIVVTGGYAVLNYIATGNKQRYSMGSIDRIYKNGVDDTANWNKGIGGQGSDSYYNLVYANMPQASYDPSATYTVDYTILRTTAPQIGSAVESFKESITDAIGRIAEALFTRQAQSKSLDDITELAMYEDDNNQAWPWVRATLNGTYALIQYYVPFKVRKNSVPIVTIAQQPILVADNSGTLLTVPASDIYSFAPTNATKNGFRLTVLLKAGTYATHALNNGVVAGCTWKADCRGTV